MFLAGDAAHQTPPFFGQGMCHGLRDVANLAWKMAAVIHEGAAPEILESYQLERDPHVRAVIGAAVEAGRYICELDPAKAAVRDAQVRAEARARGDETAADLIPALEQGVILAGTPGAGERFVQPILADGSKLDELTGGGWRLLVRDAGIGGSDSGVTKIVASDLPDGGALTAWLDARQVDAVLIRPDHYVFGTSVASAALLLAERVKRLGLSQEVTA